MTALQDWILYFNSLGVNCQAIPSNSSAVQLINVAGCPIFRVVESVPELDALHTKARQKSSEMGRLLAIALPLDHPQTLTSIPGSIHLPKVRIYGGHIGDTFSTSGHLIENEFLKAIKREVLAVISNGTRIKTPLCNWVQNLLGKNWKYGTPSSLPQLDTMLGLVASDAAIIGHIRARQLSFGRGCADALFLCGQDVVMPTNALDQKIDAGDFRFVSFETELSKTNAARERLRPIFAHRFYQAVERINPVYAQQLGYESPIGVSTITTRKIASVV